MQWLANSLGLDKTERTILAVLSRVAAHEEWEKLLEAVPGKGCNANALRLSFVTEFSAPQIEDRLAPSGRLLGTGLINYDSDGEVSASQFLIRIARSTSGPAKLARQLMPAAAQSSLEWEDFSHIGSQIDIAQELVKSDAGVSIILYGPPGTGKTEFARLLADRAGMNAVFAGLVDENGAEPNRGERLAHFCVLRALTRGDSSRLLVMDEADDILTLGLFEDRGRRSKMFLNRLIEDGKRPTIWIVNEQRGLEESILRRMTMAIEFPKPPLQVRRRVVAHHAKKARVVLSDTQADRLAALRVSPAIMASALRAARLVKGGADAAQEIGEGLVLATTGCPPAPHSLPAVYDPSLACADTKLDDLAQRLIHAPERGWSVLLGGPSGTGKSAYARYLARSIGIELIEKRGSDLLGMYVGETEANIAHAFREAARSGALLLIDEADDFLSSRRDTHRSWERSMVNEMLRQMETLKSPFVATTNLADRLDPATRRRFTLHAEFRSLDESKSMKLFERYFLKSAPDGTQFNSQTPGDFAVVAKRAALLGETDPAVLASWLEGEAEARGERSVAMGF